MGAVAKGVMGEATAGTPGEPATGSMLQRSQHPTALMFHVGFKVMGAVAKGLMVVLLLAFDFWTVKNVSGRLLVGLRWWNEVAEDGTNEWRFESREDTSRISDVDSRVFWVTLWVMPIIWGFFTVSTFFSFNYGWMLCTLGSGFKV
ncbi:hypothetical protein T484DRAFT_1812328 [Baffinella frigidus]|nr:hypothetical protein T484DRAFT_1812328 [Cryptophyta sp. CCMP2293]